MTFSRAMLLLAAGGLAVAGCGSEAGNAPMCGRGRACGGDGGPPATCGHVQPCGGDVVGDWMFIEACESAASFAASAATFATMAAQSWCVGQTLVGREPQASGSLMLDAAGTYSLAVVYGGYLDLNFPADCLAGLSCDDTTGGLQAMIDAGTYSMPGVTTISCSGSSSCLCRATVDVRRYEAGTFSTSGSVLTFTAANGVINNKSYCVVGSALHVLDTSMRPAGQTDVDSDLVALKQ